MKALAIDLGGTHASCGVIEDDQLIDHLSVDTDSAGSLGTVLGVVVETFRQLLARNSLSSQELKGVALGFPGLVDSRAGRVLSTNGKYEDAKTIDLASWSQEAFGLPLRVENDARLALLGESYAGAARGCTEVVMMTLGTGIGGVAMIEGKLLRGKHAQAGCLGGHIPVLFTGRTCTCGAVGCAEAEASGWSLPLVVKDWPESSKSSLAKYPRVGFRELFAEAAAGDAVAVAVRDRCLRIWAADAVGLIHAYDPEVLVVGGGVMQSAGAILPVLESYIHKHAWTPWGKVQVCKAALGNKAALLGAVPLLSEA
jgi:glucokinase